MPVLHLQCTVPWLCPGASAGTVSSPSLAAEVSLALQRLHAWQWTEPTLHMSTQPKHWSDARERTASQKAQTAGLHEFEAAAYTNDLKLCSIRMLCTRAA